ncbi:MAG: PD-(D/E)XK nuclease family protein [Acidimicrobiales bacterium]
MAGRIERVIPGVAAEAALVDELQRVHVADRLAPVWVVVRSPIVGLSLRRRLVERGAFAAVRFAPLAALVQQLGAAGAARGGRRPLTPVAVRTAARVALGVVPGVLAPVAGHEATEESLATTYRDLRRASAVELDRLASTSARAGDVVALVRAMRQLLEAGYHDSDDLLRAAMDQLAAGGGADVSELGNVVLYLPDPLGPAEAGLLVSLARRLELLVLAGVTGDELADRAIHRFLAALADGFGGVSRGEIEVVGTAAAAAGAGATGLGAPTVGSGADAVRFTEFSSSPDDDVEVREAVRRLIAHAEDGGDLGRCVVTFPDGARAPELHRRIAEQLAVAGVPHSGGDRQLLRDTPHARLLIGLVALAMPALPGQELDRGHVIDWLSSGPIRSDKGLARHLASVTAEGAVPVGAWDRCSRAAGVLSGISQWRDRLRTHIARLQRDPAAEPTPAAQVAADLLEFVERLHALVSAAARADSWAALRRWTDDALEELLEPGEQRTTIADAVSDLDALDALEPLGRFSASERLRRLAVALDVALDRPAGDRGRFGAGPAVGSLRAVAGTSSDLLIVLGCREGDLPAPRRDDPLLPRSERDQVASLAEREQADEAGRRHLLWALSASARSSASFARIDVRVGRAAYPSRWAAELFDGRLTDVPSFAGSIRQVVDGMAASDAADFELASLLAISSSEAPSFLELLDGDYRRRRQAALDRRAGGLNPYAGYVPAAGLAEDAWVHPLSATGLETFAACPFRFFVDRKLGVSKLEQPERLVVIDARERGTLMHAVLEGFFEENGTVVPVTVIDERSRARLRDLANTAFEELERSGKTGKAIFWDTERARILRDLERYVARDVADSVAAGRVPMSVELDFGGEGRPVVAHAAGRDVLFRGRIDRVDVTADGRLVVVDYKSGRSGNFQDILTDPLGRGRHLQLPIYAKAAVEVLGRELTLRQPARAEYRFVQAVAGYAVIPVELNEEVAAALHDVLETLVSTIDAGCFPPHPGRLLQSQYDNCQYCDFDALCTTDRAELWERASNDHEMKAFTELVGPI